MNAVLAVVLVGAVVAAVVAVWKMDPRGERNARTGNDYARETRAAGFLDPALIAWDEAATPFAMDMTAPRALAVDDADRIHVIGDRLVVLAPDGTQERRTAPFAVEYQALALAGMGRLYAVHADHLDYIQGDEDPPRVLATVPAPDARATFAAVAVTAEGVFVGDATGCRIFRLPLGLAGPDGAPAACELFVEKLMVPSTLDLAVSPDGELVTVDPGRHRVQVRDAYGDVVRAFGKLGGELEDFHGCCNPVALAMTEAGDTVTAEKGLGATRVKVYDEDGELASVVAGPSAFDEPLDTSPLVLDVAVDSTGRILVLDPGRRQVRVFTPKEVRDGR